MAIEDGFKNFLAERSRSSKKKRGKKRYGLDWRDTGPQNLSGDTSAVSEANDGALPGAFSAHVLGTTQSATRTGGDMKKRNKKASNDKLINWLMWRARAEEEEDLEEPDLSDPARDDPDLGLDNSALEPKRRASCPDFDEDDDEHPTVGDLDDLDYDEDRAFGDEYGFDPEQRKEMGYPEEEEDEFDIDPDSFHRAMSDDESDEDELNDESDEDELDFNRDNERYDDMAAYMMGDREESDEDFDEMEPGDEYGRVVSWWREHPVGDELENDFDNQFGDEEDLEMGTEEEPTTKKPRFRDVFGIDDEEDERASDEGEFGDDVENKRNFDDELHGEEEAEAVGMSTAGRGVQVGAPGSIGGGQTAFAGAGPAPKGPTKIDRARMLFQQLINRGDMTRADIIAQFVERLDTTESTAVSYYERLAKEAGLTGKDEVDDAAKRQAKWDDAKILKRGEMQTPADIDMDVHRGVPSNEPDAMGYIRTVNNAHLVYKRQNQQGTYDELWVYNIGDDMKDELKVRRAILAGTDIPQGRTQSEDGTQSYTVTTLGNGQILHITGLRN